MEINDADTMDIDVAPNYLFLAHNFATVRSFTVFTAFERELFKARHLPDISGGGFLKTRSFVNLFALSHFFRLKLALASFAFQLCNSKGRSFNTSSKSVQLTNVASFVTKSVIDSSIRTRNLTINVKCEQPQYRGRRTRPFNRREAVITPDYFLFSTVLISHQQERAGRRFFLNQDNLRFLLAFA